MYTTLHSNMLHNSRKAKDNPNVHQLMNGQTKWNCGMSVQWDIRAAMKSKEALTPATAWVTLKNIMVSEETRQKAHIMSDFIFL